MLVAAPQNKREKNGTNTIVDEVLCPWDKPFPINEGTECCRYHLRGSNCSTGDPGTLLQRTDNPNCCIDGDKTACENGKKVRHGIFTGTC